MSVLYRIGHDSFTHPDIPWVQSIHRGLEEAECAKCKKVFRYLTGDLIVHLEKGKYLKNADCLGCGAYPAFIVSERFLGILPKHYSNSNFVGGRVQFANFKSKKNYYWIIGKSISFGSLDFEKSGFVDCKFCDGCNQHHSDVIKSMYVQYTLTPRYTLSHYDVKNPFFTSRFLENLYFCTKEFAEIIQQNGLKNFRFEEVGIG
jgi:hypothetical protein